MVARAQQPQRRAAPGHLGLSCSQDHKCVPGLPLMDHDLSSRESHPADDALEVLELVIVPPFKEREAPQITGGMACMQRQERMDSLVAGADDLRYAGRGEESNTP